MTEVGNPFPKGYPPSVAADMLTRRIFSLPYGDLHTEMDRLDAARTSGKLTGKTAYAFFVVANLIRRRLEGVGEDEIRRRAEGWARIFAA